MLSLEGAVTEKRMNENRKWLIMKKDGWNNHLFASDIGKFLRRVSYST